MPGLLGGFTATLLSDLPSRVNFLGDISKWLVMARCLRATALFTGHVIRHEGVAICCVSKLGVAECLSHLRMPTEFPRSGELEWILQL